MGARQPLPVPSLRERPDICLQCGYPLVGIPAPGECPECGFPFTDGVSVVELTGVARKGGGPKWRRVVWAVLMVVAVIYSQILGLVFIANPWLSLVMLLSLFAGVVGMGATARQRKSGIEIFSITASGLGRRMINEGHEACEFVGWGAGVPVVRLERVGRVWAKIVLGIRDEHGKQQTVLRAGFRCPAADLGVLEQLIVMVISGEDMEARKELPGYGVSIFNEALSEGDT